jgi:hypothetical protein
MTRPRFRAIVANLHGLGREWKYAHNLQKADVSKARMVYDDLKAQL